MTNPTKSGLSAHKDGDITKLCKSGEAWSPRQKADAIRDIENGTHTYYVQQAGTSRVNSTVVNGTTGKYLRSTADKSSSNNSDNLPDC
ncbi:DUF3892 domain-containing protein [Roseobacter sp. HKCCD9010]|uniref:DUF3892 domain-containing protein n=1 Tax=unclassified Roseobacter TaxID=196798 RepID=UPI0014919D6A|nr:DUF3892 domain-containing protein [Rhodobacterales bacterium HKCCD4356]NNV13993.1 DUF3892 domain-containing protein [Roseobacter sp. HKCCD7357]NNV18234.1 DUF3892 domain-containing protein [Roseobacter sp. HKCCD8768]NNV27692.1 DUF3892 domain-containing protein [Roseobacter sp. HKCCD8192]NNV31935.1 DUF3892 domain-containing protein [Roseobacter sp. HKCCD9061]NNV36215.1 DUF3892 domain-containing protein [Roseobacter sp. HKCCD9073]NNV40459.1 DUF3892 domain-containing protein [Roseobacter sp. H